MKATEIISSIKEVLQLSSEEKVAEQTQEETQEVKLEERKLENGTMLIAEKWEAGAEVFIVGEEEEKIAVPVGEYELEDGMVLRVEEEGIIAEVKEKEAEEEVEEEEVEEEVEAEAEAPMPKKVIKSVSEETFFSEIQKLQDQINKLTLTENEKVEESVEDAKAEVNLASIEVEAEPIAHNPEAKSDFKVNMGMAKMKMTTQNKIYQILNS